MFQVLESRLKMLEYSTGVSSLIFFVGNDGKPLFLLLSWAHHSLLQQRLAACSKLAVLQVLPTVRAYNKDLNLRSRVSHCRAMESPTLPPIKRLSRFLTVLSMFDMQLRSKALVIFKQDSRRLCKLLFQAAANKLWHIIHVRYYIYVRVRPSHVCKP